MCIIMYILYLILFLPKREGTMTEMSFEGENRKWQRFSFNVTTSDEESVCSLPNSVSTVSVIGASVVKRGAQAVLSRGGDLLIQREGEGTLRSPKTSTVERLKGSLILIPGRGHCEAPQQRGAGCG